MRVYGHDYSEIRNPCEYCGFPCFDDELRCPNCGGDRESLLDAVGADEQARMLEDSRRKQKALRRASRRARYLSWPLLILAFLINISTLIFFQTAEFDGFARRETIVLQGYLFAFVWLPWACLPGQPGLQLSRVKDMRFRPFQFARGLVRHFQDGCIAELFYAVVIFSLTWALIVFHVEPEYSSIYHELRISSVSEELYMLVAASAFHTINFLFFMGHLLGNFLCPYDYLSELKMRLEAWRKRPEGRA
jgi:hypothetical protein